MVIVDQEEVIEISADFLGRDHVSIYIELLLIRERREDTGQHICLDLGGDAQFGADAFTLRCDPPDILDICLHPFRQRPEGIRQDLCFISGIQLPLKIEIVSVYIGNGLGELSDGADDEAGQKDCYCKSQSDCHENEQDQCVLYSIGKMDGIIH